MSSFIMLTVKDRQVLVNPDNISAVKSGNGYTSIYLTSSVPQGGILNVLETFNEVCLLLGYIPQNGSLQPPLESSN